MTKDEIEKLAEWTKPKELATKFGPRILRTAPVTEAFSAAWKTRKEEMKADGLSWRKDEKSGTWICCWWSKLDQTEVARREETKIKSTQAESDFQPTAPEGLSYRGFQRAGVEYALGAFKKFNGCIIGDEMGLGKALDIHEPVLTPGGWVEIGSLRVGDMVIGSNGFPCSVVGVYPQGKIQCYQVKTWDGATVVASKDHLWSVSCNNWIQRGRPYQVMSTECLIKESRNSKQGVSKWNVPLMKPMFGTHIEIGVHPYLIGVLLGNGNLSGCPSISTRHPQQLELIRGLLNDGISITGPYKSDPNKYHLTCGKRGSGHNELTAQLRNLGIWGLKDSQKIIPRQLLQAEAIQRLQLLQGLMDTDGTTGNGSTRFSNCSKSLIHGVRQLVLSLGGIASISSEIKRDGELPIWSVSIIMPEWIVPFQLQYHIDRYVAPKRSVRRHFESITPIGNRECVCIAVNSHDRLFVTRDYLLTHNTIQAIGCINTDPEIKRVLVVCPNTLKINWRNELRKWLVRPMRIGIQKAGDTYWGDHVDILIINFDIMAKYPQLTQSQWDMRVIDEAHYIKNPKAIRTKATLATWARRKLTMTGTPMENRPIELFTLINDIDPHRWPSRFGFAKRYCAAQHNGFGWDFDGSSNAEELQDALRSTIMIRRLKSQVLKELPPKQRQVIELPVESASGLVAKEEREWQIKQGRIDDLRVRIELAKANDDLLSYKAAVEALNDAQGAAFDEMAKLRYEIGMAKVERACDFITDALEGGKVIVFAHHLDVVHRLKKEFPQAAVVTGETKADQRQGEVERFQTKPECNVFIGNLAAAEGLTLTAADHVIFVEAQWVPGKLAQMEDRAHRIGQTENVLCSYLVLEGSLDARMLRACVDKLDVIDRTLDRKHDPLVYDEPPVIVAKGDRQPMTAKRERLVKLAEQITPEMIQEIHRALQQLAGSDVDYAQVINGVGFSKIDVRIGHELANSPRLTRMQAALGAMLCNKYRGQLGEGCWTELLAKKTEAA